MSRGVKLIRGTAARVLNLVLGMGVAFYMMPFLINALGERMYGLWALVGSLIGYYGLLDLGLSAAVGRFLSRAIGRAEGDEIRKITSTSFYLYLATGLAAVLLTVVGSYFLHLLVSDPQDLHVFRVVFILVGVSFGIDVPVRSFNSVFPSHLRDDINMGISIGRLVFTTVLIVVAINSGFGLIGLCVVSVAGSIVDSGFRIWRAYRLEPNLSISPRDFDRKRVAALYNYSVYSFISRIADILRFRIDQVIITVFVGLSAVTHYFIAVRLVEYLTNFIRQLVAVLTPTFSQDEGQNDFDAIRSKFLFATKITVYIGIFSGGLTLLYGGPFIRRWMGGGFEDSVTVLAILMIPLIINIIQKPAVPLLYGISKHRFLAYANVLEGIANLALSLWLVRSHGIIGVALGTAIPMGIMSLFVQPVYVCRAISLPVWPYISLLTKHGAVAAVALALGWVILGRIVEPAYSALVFCGLAHSALFWGLVWLVGFSGDEKRRLSGLAFAAAGFARRSVAVAGR